MHFFILLFYVLLDPCFQFHPSQPISFQITVQKQRKNHLLLPMPMPTIWFGIPILPKVWDSHPSKGLGFPSLQRFGIPILPKVWDSHPSKGLGFPSFQRFGIPNLPKVWDSHPSKGLGFPSFQRFGIPILPKVWDSHPSKGLGFPSFQRFGIPIIPKKYHNSTHKPQAFAWKIMETNQRMIKLVRAFLLLHFQLGFSLS